MKLSFTMLLKIENLLTKLDKYWKEDRIDFRKINNCQTAIYNWFLKYGIKDPKVIEEVTNSMVYIICGGVRKTDNYIKELTKIGYEIV